jgi:rod shape-determining protein MreD
MVTLVSMTILQTSAMPFFPVLGIRADLVLIFIAIWATVARGTRILFWAVAAGLFLDLSSGTPTGTNMMALTLAAYVAAMGGAGMFRTNLPWALAAVASGTLVYYPISMILLAAQGFAVPWGSAFTTTLPLAIAVNLAAALALYWPITLLERLTRGRRPYRIL